MFARVRETTFDSDKLSQGGAQLDEFFALQDRQPGFAGRVRVDAGDGRMLTLDLWESEAQATAARAVLRPEADRLVTPLYAAPLRVIAQGPVLRNDLVKS